MKKNEALWGHLVEKNKAIKGGNLRNTFGLLKVCVLHICVASSFQMLFIQNHLLLYKTSRLGAKKAVLWAILRREGYNYVWEANLVNAVFGVQVTGGESKAWNVAGLVITLQMSPIEKTFLKIYSVSYPFLIQHCFSLRLKLEVVK